MPVAEGRAQSQPEFLRQTLPLPGHGEAAADRFIFIYLLIKKISFQGNSSVFLFFKLHTCL